MSNQNEFTKQILAIVKKEYGDNIAKDCPSFVKEMRSRLVVPVSPAVNLAIGGGIPEGSWVVLAGPKKIGKTTLILHFCKQAQKPECGSKHIYFLNVEGRLKPMNIDSSIGLNQDLLTVIESSEDRILSAQDYLNIGEKILTTHTGCVLVIDSFSALCHEKEISEGVGTSTRGGGAALLAQFCRQMEGVVPVKKSIVIGVTQFMANTSGYGAATMEKGGNAIQFQMDVKLKYKGIEKWMDGDKQIGQKVTWLTECTALGMPPGMEIESCIRYGQGIDEISEAMKMAQDVGLITKSGSWYVCDFMQNHLPALGAIEWNDAAIKKCRGQGQENVHRLLKDNPSWLTFLEQDLQKMLLGK